MIKSYTTLEKQYIKDSVYFGYNIANENTKDRLKDHTKKELIEELRSIYGTLHEPDRYYMRMLKDRLINIIVSCIYIKIRNA